MNKESSKHASNLTLVGIDIEAEGNVPLLENAASLSGADFLPIRTSETTIENLRSRFDNLLACETGGPSRSVYYYPLPPGRTAFMIGNELKGVPREYSRRTKQILFVPMHPGRISSVNVAVAAAISLYVMDRDLARKKKSNSHGGKTHADILLLGPDDPVELGSLLRSVWAFGWHRVFLLDTHSVWFVEDRQIVLAGRAAAHRDQNSLSVIPFNELNCAKYDHILFCNRRGKGDPLSKLVIPKASRLLLVFGEGQLPFGKQNLDVQTVSLDCRNGHVTPQYRHAGSIFLSCIAQSLGSSIVYG